MPSACLTRVASPQLSRERLVLEDKLDKSERSLKTNNAELKKHEAKFEEKANQHKQAIAASERDQKVLEDKLAESERSLQTCGAELQERESTLHRVMKQNQELQLEVDRLRGQHSAAAASGDDRASRADDGAAAFLARLETAQEEARQAAERAEAAARRSEGLAQEHGALMRAAGAARRNATAEQGAGHGSTVLEGEVAPALQWLAARGAASDAAAPGAAPWWLLAVLAFVPAALAAALAVGPAGAPVPPQPLCPGRIGPGSAPASCAGRSRARRSLLPGGARAVLRRSSLIPGGARGQVRSAYELCAARAWRRVRSACGMVLRSPSSGPSPGGRGAAVASRALDGSAADAQPERPLDPLEEARAALFPGAEQQGAAGDSATDSAESEGEEASTGGAGARAALAAAGSAGSVGSWEEAGWDIVAGTDGGARPAGH